MLVLDVILGIKSGSKAIFLLLELKNLKLVKKVTKSDFQVSKLKVTIWSLSCAIGIPDGFKGISGELSYQQIGEVQAGGPKNALGLKFQSNSNFCLPVNCRECQLPISFEFTKFFSCFFFSFKFGFFFWRKN